VPVLLSTTAAAFGASLAVRLLAESALTQRISIVGSLVGLERIENAGIAFGIDLPPALIAILVPLALVLVLMLAWKSRHNRIHAVAFGLILGGALANVVDRLGDGLVTDFIQVGIWPLFNVADSCITIGVGMLLLCGSGRK
jgi:signal peptidase II